MVRLPEPNHVQRQKTDRSNLEQRIDVLRFVYKGADTRSAIAERTNISYYLTKEIIDSLLKKRYLQLVSAGRNGRSNVHNRYPDEPKRRRWSRLSIVITMDGLRVLLNARTLSRQLLDEEIDWN